MAKKQQATGLNAVEEFAQRMAQGATAPEVETPAEPAANTAPVVESSGAVESVESEAALPESPRAEQPDFLEVVKGLGFADVADAEAAQARLVESYRQQQEALAERERRLKDAESLAQYGREYLETLRETREKPKAVEEPRPSSWWNPPDVDTTLLRKYQTVDENGQTKWSPDTPAHLRADAEKYQAHVEKWSNDLIYRPHEALRAPIRSEVEAYLAEVLGVPVAELPARLDITGEQRAYREFVNEYGPKIYAVDPLTNRVDHSKLTPFGQLVEQGIVEARDQWGITDQRKMLEFGIRVAERQQQPVPAVPTTQRRAENRQAVLQKNGARPQGTGGLPSRGTQNPPERRQNSNLSPGQSLLQRLEGLAS